MKNSIENRMNEKELQQLFDEYVRDPLQYYILNEIINNQEETSFSYSDLEDKFSLDRGMIMKKSKALLDTKLFYLEHRTKCCFIMGCL